MNAKEKFNDIMQIIEKEVVESVSGDKEIVELIQKKYLLSIKEINNIFPFLINDTLRNYIRERRIMNEYHSILFANTWEDAIYNVKKIYHCCDQAEFSKKFKQQFNMTPKEAYNLKDESLEKPPLNWELISNNDFKDSDNTQENTQAEIFGIKKEKLDEIIEAIEWQKYYGFSDKMCESIYDIYKKKNIPLKDLFSFFDDYRDHMPLKENIVSNDFIDMLIYTYFYRLGENYSVSEVTNLVLEAIDADIDVRETPSDFYESYLDGKYFPEFSFKKYFELNMMYNDLYDTAVAPVQFEDFVLNLSLDIPPQEAIEDDFQEFMSNAKLPSDEEILEDLEFEKRIEDQTEEAYYDESDYDDFEPDNPYYYDD